MAAQHSGTPSTLHLAGHKWDSGEYCNATTKLKPIMMTRSNTVKAQLICFWPPLPAAAAPGQSSSKESLPFSPWRPGDAYRWFGSMEDYSIHSDLTEEALNYYLYRICYAEHSAKDCTLSFRKSLNCVFPFHCTSMRKNRHNC